jgi:outer membrane receptor protein involved in Fe transport
MMLENRSRSAGVLAVVAVLATWMCNASAFAQLDQLDDEAPSDDELAPSTPAAAPPASEAEPAAPSAPSPSEAAAAGGASVSMGANTNAASTEGEASSAAANADANAPKVDGQQEPPARSSDRDEANPVRAGSNIRRPVLMPDGALVIDGPLATEVQGREYLQTRRQLGGVALPDTTAALGQGGPGTSSLELRLQPTLILLNGRRLVSAPYFGPAGSDFIDINQLPIQLIDHVEFVRGNVAGVYGDGAAGGAVNFVTRRNYKGVEVEVGGQTTDKFDQHEEDVALTLGAGSEDTGINVMVSYFNRSPLAATDRDWIKDRDKRVNSLLGSPSSFKPLINFDYPFPDPYCDIATKAGQADGLQVRIPQYGPPETLGLLPPDVQQNLLNTYDKARGNGDGKLDALETSTYCSGNFTRNQDLVLKDERLQTYSTFWHKFSEHTEGYGELGYYRSNNSNRTAPSFPIIRLTPDVNNIEPVWVPPEHADQPVQARGFAAAEVAMGRVPQNQFIVGRIIGTYAGSGENKRRTDVFRGVLGMRGDLKAAGAGSILETWDWDVSGVYTGSESVSSVQDVLMDKLRTALNSCGATRMDGRNTVMTTIKDRQEAGCFNPFYSSVTNNAALDPLHVSNKNPSSSRGFVTTDTDAAGQVGHGVQDGGYICDPSDPNSPPCPAAFDRDGDGTFELAGTPNTKQVVDRLLGEQITVQRRTLGTADATMRGDIAHFAGGGLGFGVGGQFRRETMSVDYDSAYNQRLYGFLFGGPDVPNVGRNIAAGYAELRLRLLQGAIELQPAARIEHYDNVGTAVSPMVGLALRPFAAGSTPPPALEWLMLRGHIGRGNRAPSLLQMYGTQNEFESVEFFHQTLFVPHQVSGNPNLDFEKYTTISGGLQWDFAGIHVGADFWTTQINDLIGSDNTKTLAHDCQQQYSMPMTRGDCHEVVLLTGNRTLDHFESSFDNLADVSTNGIDGGASYTLDSKKRDLGDFGTFVIGVQGTFINSYLIKSPRALREYYRTGDQDHQNPKVNADGTRDYSGLSAEYEAAGYRNLDNFAPPIPRLRFAVPLRWMYGQHLFGITMRYISGYNDDSEWTVERYGLPGINDLANAPGEAIPSWTVFDVNYGLTFGDEVRRIRIGVGVINVLDTPPPAVESPLGYEVGIHDPRGRIVYARVTGSF